VPAAEGHSFCF